MSIAAPEAQRIASLVPEKGQGKMVTIDEALGIEPKLRAASRATPASASSSASPRNSRGSRGTPACTPPASSSARAARRTRAVLQERRSDRHPVRQGRHRSGRPREVRLSRAEDAHGDRRRAASSCTRARASTARPRSTTARRSGDVRAARGRRDDRCLPARIERHAGGPAQASSPTASRTSSRRRALSSGAARTGITTSIGSKHGRKSRAQAPPAGRDVLAPTYGVLVYQEQVMQIAQQLRAIRSAKRICCAARWARRSRGDGSSRRTSSTGAVSRGVAARAKPRDFRPARSFASYGFNKSHSAAYALVTYQTAYLKANYPVEFLAASMTLDLDNTEKLAEFRREAQRLGIGVEPPSVNRSGVTFEVDHGESGRRSATRSPPSRGSAARPSRRSCRHAARRLSATSPTFPRRINPRLVNKRTVEAFIAAGALDALEMDRAQGEAAVEAIWRWPPGDRGGGARAERFLRWRGCQDPEPLRIPPDEPWLPAMRLQKEYDAIGFFLSGHPLDEYGALLERLRVQRWTDFARAVRNGASAGRLAVTVLDRTERRTKSGSKMGIVTLSDPVGTLRGHRVRRRAAAYRDLLEPGRAVDHRRAGRGGGRRRAGPKSQTPSRSKTRWASTSGACASSCATGRRLKGVAQRLTTRGEARLSVVLISRGRTRGRDQAARRATRRRRRSPARCGAIPAWCTWRCTE